MTISARPDASAVPSGVVATRVALVVALVCLLQPGAPPPAAILAAIACVGLLVASARWSVGRSAIVVLVLAGLALRLLPPSGFSDVLIVTEAAIREMLAGGNPYGHGFEASVPPGAPFPYGPVALLWYLPVIGDPKLLELWASVVVLVTLGVRGRPIGLAVYAVMPALLSTVSDGPNDQSVGLLLLVALLTTLRWPVGGAVLLALVTAFKPYALAWLPGLIGYAGVGPLVAFGVASVAVWLLPVVAWGPDAILWSIRRADAIHAQPYYSLAYALGDQGLPQRSGKGCASRPACCLRSLPWSGRAQRAHSSSWARSSSGPRSSWAGGARSPISRLSRPSCAGISTPGSAWTPGASPGPATPSAASAPGSTGDGPSVTPVTPHPSSYRQRPQARFQLRACRSCSVP